MPYCVQMMNGPRRLEDRLPGGSADSASANRLLEYRRAAPRAQGQKRPVAVPRSIDLHKTMKVFARHLPVLTRV